MKTLSSVEVQNRFGSIANIVKSGEPVAVTQYGKPARIFRRTLLAHDVFVSADTFNELAEVLARSNYLAALPAGHGVVGSAQLLPCVLD